MKEPRMTDLSFDSRGTKALRKRMKRVQRIKITINLDADLIGEIKKASQARGQPYQRLVNDLLRESLNRRSENESRIDRLEREIKVIKKRLAA